VTGLPSRVFGTGDRDYLMPCGASPRAVERTGIAISYVRDRLSRCGADNVILMLDACRREGSRDARALATKLTRT